MLEKQDIQTIAEIFHSSMNPIKEELQNVKGEVLGLKAQVQDVQSEVQELKGQVQGVQSEVQEVKGQVQGVVSRLRQHRHLKRKKSILFLVFLDFPHFFIHSGWQDTLF